MKTFELFFGNLFDRPRITTFRLVAFGRYTHSAISANNTDNVYSNYIDLLDQRLKDVENEMDQVDLGLAIQLSKTGTVDDIVEEFENFMSSAYIDIAYKTKSDPEVLAQFYPRGKSEYNRVRRSDAHIIMNRVHELATTHTSVLEYTLSENLKSYLAKYTAARDTQVQQITNVNMDRSERNTSRPALELMLTEVMHEIARQNPGDLDACKGLVRWNLLFPTSSKGSDDEESTPES